MRIPIVSKLIAERVKKKAQRAFSTAVSELDEDLDKIPAESLHRIFQV